MEELETETRSRQTSLADILAWLVSFVFHPLLMPSYIYILGTLGIEGFIAHDGEAWWRLLQFFVIMTFIFPGLMIVLMRRLGLVSSITLDNAQDRPLPMFLTGLIYAITIYLLRASFVMNFDFMLIMIGITATVIVTALISLFIKISAHAIGTASTMTYLLLLSARYPENNMMPLLLAMIVGWGATLASRLQLKAHTGLQVWLGSLLGVVLAYVSMSLL